MSKIGVHNFASGFGQSDTHKNDGSDYEAITPEQIMQMVRVPRQSVDKSKAQWVIPSTYIGHDARSHSVQRERGAYGMLAIDVDEGSPSLEQLDAALVGICGDESRAIYSTSGATADNLKWRAFVFLRDTITGAEYSDYQTALFDLLGERGIQCDRALARAGQLIYLPNRGTHYQHKVSDGPMLLSLPASIIKRAKQNADSAERAHAAQRKLAEQRASERAKRNASCVAGDDVSLIDWFNSRNSVEQLFNKYGYESVGQRQDYISPQSTSKSVSVKIYDDKGTAYLGRTLTAVLGSGQNLAATGMLTTSAYITNTAAITKPRFEK
ncbi:hypothetical protein N9P17_02560 [Tateyamaria sp.]|nr:hypothetical protein [Tateyamaria sp.]